jgi:hypothetical protein
MGRAAPFRLTAPPPPLERSIHESVAGALDMLLPESVIWWPTTVGGTKLDAQQQAALSRLGVKRALPDLMVLHAGRIYGIELKRPGSGRLSKTRIVTTRRGARVLLGQDQMFPRLEAAGMTIAIARSVDEVLAQLEAWSIPLRGRVTAKRLPRADEIHDPDFTGGLESVEYVRRLRDGTLP